jgi:gentisate 1,2-dioxygenase
MTTGAELWEDLFRRALDERRRKGNGRTVISYDDLEAETTPFGLVRWYLHPLVEDAVDRSLYFFELEIPADSRSGMLRHQGNLVHLVVQGHGYTVLNGERHDWEDLDVIAVAPRPDGVVLQHFNEGSRPVRMLVTFPNFDSALGPELGVAMEVIEPCPESQAGTTPSTGEPG